MNISCGCITEKGNYRSKNQDRIMCNCQKVGDNLLAIACVCDGIGSFANSEVASEMMVNGLTKWFAGIVQYYPNVMGKRELIDDLELTIRELNELICQYGKVRKMELGCTMSLIFVMDWEYYIFHVGDSRIYLLQESMFQLTQDEVVLKQESGREKTLLLNYIGKNNCLVLNRQRGSIKRGDTFILGTDGLNKKMTLEDIQNIRTYFRTNEELELECNRLIRTVMEREEKDNVSCGIMQISDK